MLPEFIEFCQKLFPCIDPYTAEQAKVAMRQFDGDKGPSLVIPAPSLDYCQGDIYTEIPFYYTSKTGELRVIKRKAQLLSNTCDASRDDRLLFAAVHPLNDLADNASLVDAIRRNLRFSAFYLPDNIMEDEYVDFELINAMSREMFDKLCKTGKVRRIASLTQVGYFMLICKLTVFFMRPEDAQVNSERA